ncbi:MAG TPA: FAD-dependent oxidoreductase [Phycisphaerales bacterium]|nr:FAD-dependent oxidoreductase [Phycisphaerales bacterium]
MTSTDLTTGILILGGGVAGLWILDSLRRAGHDACLVETTALGAGQTGASQGIIHGGLKYTLSGFLSPSAKAIRDMPDLWRECLAGRSTEGPDLSRVALRSPHCYLWRTDSLRSRAGMIGAQLGLRAAALSLELHERPEILRDVPGTVARVDEPVIDVFSLISELARPHADRLLPADRVEPARDGETIRVSLTHNQSPLTIRASRVILAAGAGNGPLRAQLGLAEGAMQLRPLHMVLLRGPLPPLHGHCVDGARTRVTITSIDLPDSRRVWQVGGQIAEDGVNLSPAELIQRARAELLAVVPGLDLGACEWSTYHADRAEGRTRSGARPEDITVLEDGPVITAWPTKLALAPVLAERVVSLAGAAGTGRSGSFTSIAGWPRPPLATPVWETVNWLAGDSVP